MTRYYTSSRIWQIEESLGGSDDYECILPDCEPVTYIRFVYDVLDDLRQRLNAPNLNKPSANYVVLQAKYVYHYYVGKYLNWFLIHETFELFGSCFALKDSNVWNRFRF